tara:strand:+ start:544 stop:1068 length:525 start_codon:yes stop_codon:yes gene_type:complete
VKNFDSYSVQKFYSSSFFDSQSLKAIYALNQTNAPEVGFLNSLEYLKELLEKSYINFCVKNDNEIIGLMVCFREGSDYSSKNYKFFKDNENHFLYIDRVVIKEEYRRNGIASHLYNSVEEIAIKLGSPLCCEVNTFPENKPSIEFHEKLGFVDIGKNDFEENSVVYYKKYCKLC